MGSPRIYHGVDSRLYSGVDPGSPQNLSLPPRIYSPFQQIYMCALPDSTPSSHNLPLFQQLHATLPESTPPSRNNPPPLSITICNTPRIYPSLTEDTPSRSFSTTICYTQNIPPLFIKFICATLSESTPLSQHLLLPPRIHPTPFQQLVGI